MDMFCRAELGERRITRRTPARPNHHQPCDHDRPEIHRAPRTFLYAGSRPSHSSTGSTSASTASWPASTPRLNSSSAGPTSPAGSPSSASTPAKPKPWMDPNGRVIRQRPAASATKKFSRPTYAIDSAIAGSTHQTVGRPDPQGRQREAQRVAERERCDHRDERAQPAADHHEPEQEHQVVGADQDVFDPELEVRRHRPPCPSPAAPSSGTVADRRARVQHPLGEDVLEASSRRHELRDVAMPCRHIPAVEQRPPQHQLARRRGARGAPPPPPRPPPSAPRASDPGHAWPSPVTSMPATTAASAAPPPASSSSPSSPSPSASSPAPARAAPRARTSPRPRSRARRPCTPRATARPGAPAPAAG